MTELVNRRGVNAVEEHVLAMEWFFRDQPISDQGIDAHAEKAPGGVGTGRLIAMQIKSGPSYFDESTEHGWTFRFSAKKARLWLSHGLPVLVVLVDLADRTGYWQHISEQTVVSTGAGFKVEVPRSNRLADADASWTHIACGIEQRATERFDLALSQLPPHARTVLEKLAATAAVDASVLALHLAEGRGNSRATVQSLLMTSPGWLSRNTPESYRALASYAAEHEHGDVSADAFEIAAQSAPNPANLLAAAALNVMPYDTARSTNLLHTAEQAEPHSPLVAIGRALLNHPPGDAGARAIPAMLLADTESLRGNVAVQAFLSDQARRANDLVQAGHHASLALHADPESSDSMVRVAEIMLRRVQAAQAPDQDIAGAIELLDAAHQQRREWAGPTVQILVHLLRACALVGQFDDMLGRALPAPMGSATAQEAADPQVLRLALTAASLAGRRDLLESLSTKLGDDVQDNFARLRAGTLALNPEDERDLLEAEFRRAVESEDAEAIAQTAVALAAHRVDMSEAIGPFVERSIIPLTHLRLIEALATVPTDFDTAMATLRSLARTDMGAAEHLIGELVSAGRFSEASEACAAQYELTGSAFFLMARAEVLIQAESWPEAEDAARIAAAQNGFPYQRRKFLTFLGGRAVERENWDDAEKHLSAVLKLTSSPRDSEVWNFLTCLVNQGRLVRAAQVWRQHRPSVHRRDQAVLWLQANAASVWDESDASEALSLARRFNDPELSTALLGRIVTATRVREPADDEPDPGLEARRRLAQGSVSADLHRQAFAALNELVAEFGEATGVTVVQGSPEELIEQMSETLRALSSSAAPMRELAEAARNSRAPLGILASVRGGSYATLLTQRLLPLIAGAADDAEHDVEVSNAEGALGAPVVVDTAALHTLTADGSLAHLDGHFPALLFPTASIRDVHRAVFEIRGLAGSPGTAGWDPEANSLVLYELADDEFIRQLRRSIKVEQRAETLSIKAVPDLGLFGELGNESAHAPWLAPIQLAHDQQLCLWSDDLGLRRFARQLGVRAFGTPALIDALRDRALHAATRPQEYDRALATAALANRDLAADMVADVALHLDDLLALAELTDWLPTAGALVLSRPSWWAWQPSPLSDIEVLYAQVRQHRPERIGEWQHAAMIGAARAYQQSGLSTKVLAAIALLGWSSDSSVNDITDGCLRARRVAAQLDLPDPIAQLPAAAAALAKADRCEDPIGLVEAVLTRLPAPDERHEDTPKNGNP